MGDTSDDESLAALPTGVSVKPLRTIDAKRRFYYLLYPFIKIGLFGLVIF